METEYNRLLVAPHSIRSGLIERIELEVANHRAGLPAGVRIKCNSIVDEATIDALYRASQAGVPVDVWVRGICALRPGVPGLSDNIRVRSVLGRFLEHSRLFEFTHGGEPEIWIGSADLMHRNLDRRIEVLVRLGSATQTAQLGGLFDLAFDPGTSTWHLGSDGGWARHNLADDGTPLVDVQSTLIARQTRRSSAAS
jgi:polyphosphate kinase